MTERVKTLNIKVDIDSFLLLDKEEEKYNKKEAKKDKELDTGIEIESFVFTLEKEKWEILLEYYERDGIKIAISPMQLDILKKYVSGYIMPASPKQAKILYQLYIDALDEGCIFS